MAEARVVERQPTAGVLPARIEAERLDRFAVREALEPLQHHYRGHDPRWHATPANLGEQVREQLIGKQPVTLAVQHRPDRLLPDPALAHRRRTTPQIRLLGGRPGCHRPLPLEKHIHVILPDHRSTSEPARSRKTPAT